VLKNNDMPSFYEAKGRFSLLVFWCFLVCFVCLLVCLCLGVWRRSIRAFPMTDKVTVLTSGGNGKGKSKDEL